MAERNPPAYLSEGDYDAADDRTLLAALFGTRDPLTPAGGIIPADAGGVLDVSQSGGGMAVSVTAGQAVIPATEGGVYVVSNDAAVVLPLTPADATNPRTDRVVARVHDADAGDATDLWALEVIAGVPAGVPAPPALPANALPLALVVVPAGSTGGGVTVLDVRTRATGLGMTGRHTPRGVVALRETPGTGTISSTHATDTGQVTFTAEAGRLYRVRYDVSVVEGDSVGFDGSYSAQVAAQIRLRYAIGAGPTETSPQVSMGGVRNVAAFGYASNRSDGATCIGYLTGLADGDEVHVSAFIITLLGGFGTLAGSGTLEVADVGAWPISWPQ